MSQYVSNCQQQSYSGLRSCDNHAQPTVWYCFMVLFFCFTSSVSGTGSTDVNAHPPTCKSSIRCLKLSLPIALKDLFLLDCKLSL